MKLRLVAGVTAVAGVAVLIGRHLQVTRQRESLRATLDLVPDGLVQRLVRDSREPYRLPVGVKMTCNTAIGEVRLITASGRYAEKAILVYLPKGCLFPIEMIVAFHEATGFLIEVSAEADAMISAGQDYAAYLRGEQGFWKDSSAPDLDKVAAVLVVLITEFHEKMACTTA